MSPRCQCCYGKVKVAYCPECGGTLQKTEDTVKLVLHGRAHLDARALTLIQDLIEHLGCDGFEIEGPPARLRRSREVIR